MGEFCIHQLRIMKSTILGIILILAGHFNVTAQQINSNGKVEQEIIQLSKDKWQWMADKNTDKLAPLFHNQSKFVHLGGTWKKEEELEIIKSGGIWYKKTDVHDVAVEVFQNTAIVWSRITLYAVLRDTEVKNEFTVTEFFQKEKSNWQLLALTFSSVRDNHVIKH
jgi:Domain of unknown function (DUF4440)